MKVTELANRLAPALPVLRCPLCGQPFKAEGGQLSCGGGHAFDLSAKGYVNLAPSHDQRREKYDGALFDSRGRLFEAGFYLPVLSAIETILERRFGALPFALADAGCGEGYYTRSIAKRFPQALCFGVDLSRDGIQRAARERGACWLVGDLKRLPFADHSLDVLLDVLTPADYAAFRRVLKPDGELIKVIPGDDYLKEVRASVKNALRHPDYGVDRVLEHLEKKAQVLERLTIRRVFPLTPQQSADFLHMTPMTFSVPEAALDDIMLKEITIHMELIRCRVGTES